MLLSIIKLHLFSFVLYVCLLQFFEPRNKLIGYIGNMYKQNRTMVTYLGTIGQNRQFHP